MTPHKASNGRGTLLFDRQFDGVGRIRTASGTKDPKLFKQLDRMLTRLFEARQLDVLRAIGQRQLKPLAVWDLYRAGDLSSLPKGTAVALLEGQWDRWVAATRNPSTRATRRQAKPLLLPFMPPSPLSAHLPAALRAFRLVMDAGSKPAQFNRVRAAVLAFTRDTVGIRDEVYLDVLAVPSLQEVKAKRSAPPPELALAVAEALPAEASKMWWSMYCHGMGRKEYWGRWEADEAAGQVAIHGEKRSARDRVVPLVESISRPTMHHRTYENLFAKLPAALGKIQPYDARRGFAHLTELAGIPPTRRKQLMGHSLKGDVTDGYSGVNLAHYLAEDGQAMRKQLAAARARLKKAQRSRLKLA